MYEKTIFSNDVTIITDPILFPFLQYVNKSFSELTGYHAEECLGKPAIDLMDIQDNGTKNLVKRDVSVMHVHVHVCIVFNAHTLHTLYMYMYITGIWYFLIFTIYHNAP